MLVLVCELWLFDVLMVSSVVCHRQYYTNMQVIAGIDKVTKMMIYEHYFWSEMAKYTMTYYQNYVGKLLFQQQSKNEVYQYEISHRWHNSHVISRAFEIDFSTHTPSIDLSDCWLWNWTIRIMHTWWPDFFLIRQIQSCVWNTHNRNGTMISGTIGGCIQAYGYAKRDLDTYKKDRGSHIFESR